MGVTPILCFGSTLRDRRLEYIALIVTIVSATMLALLAAFIGLVSDVFVRLPKNGYGLCSGSNNGIPELFRRPSFNRLAARIYSELGGVSTR